MSGGIKITTADSVFSKCVRLRVDYHCEVCGKQYNKSSTGLHCSHLWTRANYSVRFHPDAAFSHCYSCHLWFGGNPVDAAKWAETHLGEARIEILRDIKNDTNIGKMVKKSLKEVAAHYRAELKRMEGLRAEGYTGRLEFNGWI